MNRRSPMTPADPATSRRPVGRMAWSLLALMALATLPASASGQETGLYLGPDLVPNNGPRVEGPLLRSRPGRSVPDPNPSAEAPPPPGLGPFETDPDPRPDDSPDEVEPVPVVPTDPLLAVPPVPMAADPPPVLIDGRPWTEGAVEPRRTAEITGPVGVLGNKDTAFAHWFHDTFLWPEPLTYIPLPGDLLWKVPLANQREPRMYAKFTNFKQQSFIDTAIGAQFGLGRFAPEGREHEGFQLDVFAAVFTRFNDKRLLTAADYRAGIPLTYAKGPWSTKLSYEHTSTHIGDEYSEATGRMQKALAIDEIVLGISRNFGEHLRVYGQYGYAFLTSKYTNANMRNRFDFGISYSNYEDTGVKGRPYIAYDIDIRQYQNYNVNNTFQVGWQWVRAGRSVRIGYEYYGGLSPYGQFYKQQENWSAIGFYLDW
ncbi:DUF1207 domain-containing protein (plasmid) [Tundrisphaera sp. TA3]|uniref:DUF1207 domain-containing protein n=1 Tax=Tundrisphaera sp. TA3 TaxID=3435775 RepID=UPI003EB8171C